MSNPEPANLVPVPTQSQAAERLGTASWRVGRLALGILLVLVAVLGGALVLQRAQRLQPVYVAAHDLPSGTVLDAADLTVARVHLPDAELRHYLQPTRSQAAKGRVLTTPVPKDALVPAAHVAASTADANMVELPISAETSDVARGLRPGDRVQVLAAYSDGPRRGQAVVLLPSVEVTQLLQEAGGISGTDRQTGVQVRMPSDRAPLVTAAIASARIFIVKAPPGSTAASLPVPGVGNPAQPGPPAATTDPNQPTPPSATSGQPTLPGAAPSTAPDGSDQPAGPPTSPR